MTCSTELPEELIEDGVPCLHSSATDGERSLNLSNFFRPRVETCVFSALFADTAWFLYLKQRVTRKWNQEDTTIFSFFLSSEEGGWLDY